MSNRKLSLVLLVVACIGMGILFSPSAALAHTTTSTCWEQWQSPFANSHDSDNYRLGFMGWNKLDANGNSIHSSPAAGVAPGCADANCTSVLPWPGYATTSWFWRHRCGEHYIRLDDDAGEGHTWFEEWGSDSVPAIRSCDPLDGKGAGFVAQSSTYHNGACQDWANGTLKWVTNHEAGYSLILWSEHTTDHQPVIFDLQYVQVVPNTTNTTMEVSIKTGSGPNDWWIQDLPPNAPTPDGSQNGYYYTDTTGWAFEVERAVFTTAPGQNTPFTLGGLYYSTPSVSGWGFRTTTVPVTLAADAYLRGGTSANTNFGTATTLQTKTSTDANENRIAYLLFYLTGLNSTVTSAKLRLFGNSVTSAKAHDVTAIANTTWGETSITYNNRPAVGATLGTQTIGTTPAWVEYDVTSYVQQQKLAGNSAVSFKIRSNVTSNDGPTTFSSKEGANPPQLVIMSD